MTVQESNLGGDYYRLETFGKYDFITLKTANRISRLIAFKEEDILSHYKENGNLKKLNIPGIGQKTKSKLELILNLGIENLMKTQEERRKAEMEDRIRFGNYHPAIKRL